MHLLRRRKESVNGIFMTELFQLFCSFFKIGLFSFGGGYAMLPMLQRELIERRDWVTEDEILDYFSIAQCTPGVIAVNTATFVGYKKKGVGGAALATFGVVFPSLIIITLIAALLSNFAEIEAVQHALVGIRAAVCVLIGTSVYKLIKKAVKDKLALAIYIIVLILAVTNLIPTYITVISVAVLGFVTSFIKAKKGA